MSIFGTLLGLFSMDQDSHSFSSSTDFTEINPATGLPMIDGIGSVDGMGNPFGCDLSEMHSSSFDSLNDPFDMSSSSFGNSFDDSFGGGCGGGFDDSFGGGCGGGFD